MPLTKKTAARWRALPVERRRKLTAHLAEEAGDMERNAEASIPESAAATLRVGAEVYRLAHAVLVEVGTASEKAQPKASAKRAPFTTTLRADARVLLEAEARKRGLRVNQVIEMLALEQLD